MRIRVWMVFVALLASGTTAAAGRKDQIERLDNAADVLKEVLALPEGVPTDVFDKAECILVFPSVKKFAMGIGGNYGKGTMICRSGSEFDGPWGAPAMMRLEGASFGFQIGGSATDFVLCVMNPKGAKSLLSSKVKLGADAGVAAGPVGRTAAAATDAAMNAEILSYSRSKGIFAGISLEGSTLREDKDDNEALYGQAVSAKEIVLEGKVAAPKDAKRLLELLQQTSSKKRSH